MIQSVNRALDILTIVSDARGEPVTLSLIAQRAKLNTSTCAHLVKTLCEKGFLTQVSRSSGYILGAYAYYLTRYKTFQKELINTCNPAIRWIQRKTGHTALLAVLVEGEKFVISYSEESKDLLRERGELFRGNLYNSASGRAMLCAMRRSELAKLVERNGLPGEEDWPGIDSLETLEERLRRIAAEKVVCIERETGEGYDAQYGISIRTPKTVNCAIGVHVRQERPPDRAEREQLLNILTAGARETNRRLRFERDLI